MGPEEGIRRGKGREPILIGEIIFFFFVFFVLIFTPFMVSFTTSSSISLLSEFLDLLLLLLIPTGLSTLSFPFDEPSITRSVFD